MPTATAAAAGLPTPRPSPPPTPFRPTAHTTSAAPPIAPATPATLAAPPIAPATRTTVPANTAALPPYAHTLPPATPRTVVHPAPEPVTTDVSPTTPDAPFVTPTYTTLPSFAPRPVSSAVADPQSELVRSESDRHHATASVTPTVSNTVPGPAASPGPRLASSVDSSDVLVCPTEPDTASVTALPRPLDADPVSATAALAHPTAHQTPTHSSRIKHLRAPPSPNRSTQRTGLGPAPPPLPPTLATVPAPVAAVAPFAPSLPTVTETADPTTSIATNQTPPKFSTLCRLSHPSGRQNHLL